MRRGKRFLGKTAVDENSQLGFVSRPEPVDELRKRPAVIAHREGAVRQRLRPPAPSISFHHNIEWLLLESANMNLPLFPKNYRLHPIAGHVIAADLHLRRHVLSKPKIAQI